MSAEEVRDPDVGKFRGFGRPRETPHYEVSVDPTMQRMAIVLNAEMEARRLGTEAEMNTPENREKAAKMVEAKLAEKRRAWGRRVGATPLDGFKGIYDSAEDRELRVYTRTYDLKHKFWGIKPVGMTIWDFWDVHDPEVKRYHDANQETPASPEASLAPLPQTDSSQRIKASGKPKRRQESSKSTPTNGVRKSTKPSPKVNKNTRKSLADKLDSELTDQRQETPKAAPVSGRTTRKRIADPTSNAQQRPLEDMGSAPSTLPRGRPSVKAKAAAKEDSLLPKRSRGRPPVKREPTERPPNQRKTPAVKGDARITKPTKKERPPPSPPSVHKMRTRRQGPAELLQLP